jgi:hypothetical protein
MTDPLSRANEHIGLAYEEAIVLTGTLNAAKDQFDKLLQNVLAVSGANPGPILSMVLADAQQGIDGCRRMIAHAAKMQGDLLMAAGVIRQEGPGS